MKRVKYIKNPIIRFGVAILGLFFILGGLVMMYPVFDVLSNTPDAELGPALYGPFLKGLVLLVMGIIVIRNTFFTKKHN